MSVILGGAVQLMTVHQSKGLEFPMVFVPDVNAGFNFGEQESLDGQRGTVLLGDPEGEHIEIPYRLYDENRAALSFEETMRTEFPGL